MKKYQIVSGWYNQSQSWCEGSKQYENIIELVEDYKNFNINSKVIRISLTCEYSNSLNYNERDILVLEDYKELNSNLISHGILDYFVMMKSKQANS